MKVKIKITQEHIDAGCDRTSTRSRGCPAARAINALRPKYKGRRVYAHVGWDHFSLYQRRKLGSSEWVKLPAMKLPKRLFKFVEDFDSNRPVKPSTFTITLPEGVTVQ